MSLSSNNLSDKVLSSVGVQRIQRDSIETTIKHVSDLTGIPTNDLHLLGSAGKSDSSGDLDFAIDNKKYDIFKIHQQLIKTLGPNFCTFNKGTRVASYAVNVEGNQSLGLVQVDLMPVNSVEWAKFAYYSAGDLSKYKGAVRTLLLMGIAASLNQPGIDYFLYSVPNPYTTPVDKQLVIRVGRTFDLSGGLRQIFQYRPRRKHKPGYLKALKTVSKSEFKRLYPEIPLNEEHYFNDNPQQVVQILFNDKSLTPDDVNTAEQIINLIKTHFTVEQQNIIFEFTAKRGKNISQKINFPKEIQQKWN